MPAANTLQADVLAWLNKVAPAAQLSSDSRTVADGDVFFAYPGDDADGRTFIAHAIQKGARAVVYEADGFNWDGTWTVPHLAVAGLKKNAGPIASAYYDRPDARMLPLRSPAPTARHRAPNGWVMRCRVWASRRS